MLQAISSGATLDKVGVGMVVFSPEECILLILNCNVRG